MKRVKLKDNPIQLTADKRMRVHGRDIHSPVHKVQTIEGALSLLHLDDDRYLLVMKGFPHAVIIESSQELEERPLQAYFAQNQGG